MSVARRASVLLLIAYPVAVHYGILATDFGPALLILAAMAAMAAGQRATGFHVLPAAMAALLVLLAAWWLADGFILLLWPPLFIYFGLAALFALSLMPGRMPVVTRIASMLDGELDTSVLRYTRHVTIAWALFLFSLGSASVWLACCGSREAWSLFTNWIGYGLILAFFCAEFFWRRRCLPQLPRRSFAAFMVALMRIHPRSWR